MVPTRLACRLRSSTRLTARTICRERRTIAAWTLTSCSKMRGLILADVVQVPALWMTKALLAASEGLHRSLEAREWSRVRCCSHDDAFRVAGAVWHGIWYAQIQDEKRQMDLGARV